MNYLVIHIYRYFILVFLKNLGTVVEIDFIGFEVFIFDGHFRKEEIVQLKELFFQNIVLIFNNTYDENMNFYSAYFRNQR